jgi:hypothetical protein
MCSWEIPRPAGENAGLRDDARKTEQPSCVLTLAAQAVTVVTFDLFKIIEAFHIIFGEVKLFRSILLECYACD